MAVQEGVKAREIDTAQLRSLLIEDDVHVRLHGAVLQWRKRQVGVSSRESTRSVLDRAQHMEEVGQSTWKASTRL
ncbi:MAG: hypothetical protein CEE40_08485 [Chloroflexi bacterium B3_Chlor]|nr:MAG: hypothetical protein CEE40_08485 [Chloroflexi bacterium B3_Chlor]